MQYWLDEGWAERDIHHWYSLRKIARGADGETVCASTIFGTESAAALAGRAARRATVQDRGKYWCQ
eukprot:3566993-Pyramimonas_sp.AAC.1